MGRGIHAADAEEEVQKAMEMLDCEAIYQQVPQIRIWM